MDLPLFTLQVNPAGQAAAGLQGGDRSHAANQPGITADGVARSGFEGAHQQEDQQQPADQPQAEHHWYRDFGIGQDHRANYEHHDAAQAHDPIIRQGCFSDQETKAEDNQPNADRVGAQQHDRVRRES